MILIIKNKLSIRVPSAMGLCDPEWSVTVSTLETENQSYTFYWPPPPIINK
jgi:hypothetical protein